MFCNQLSFPAITSFIVLYAREIGIGAIGSYFVVSGVTSVLARPLLDRVSDRIGIGYSLFATFTLQSLALMLLVTAANLATIWCARVLYMLGMAIGGSATLIIAMKRATPVRRGRFMAAFSIAYPLGYGVGAFITGIAVEMIGYSWTYLLLAALGLSGLVLTLVNWSDLQSHGFNSILIPLAVKPWEARSSQDCRAFQGLTYGGRINDPSAAKWRRRRSRRRSLRRA